MATLKKKWDWSLILAGILLLACGLLCCFAPNLTLATIAMIAGVGFLLSGVLGIVFYVRFRSMMSVSGWSLAYAILDVLIGLMFVLHPLVGGAAISWLVALCFLVFGLFEIFAAMKSKSIGFSAWGVGHYAVRLADLILSARSRVRAVARRRNDRRGRDGWQDRLSLEERRGRYADRCADRRPMDARRASKQAAR